MIRRPPRSTLFPARTAADGVHRFPDGGWTVWREAGLLVTFDHGPLGLGALAAHGHADALSVTIWRGTDGIAVDPGTFAYQEDAAARERRARRRRGPARPGGGGGGARARPRHAGAQHGPLRRPEPERDAGAVPVGPPGGGGTGRRVPVLRLGERGAARASRSEERRG